MRVEFTVVNISLRYKAQTESSVVRCGKLSVAKKMNFACVARHISETLKSQLRRDKISNLKYYVG